MIGSTSLSAFAATEQTENCDTILWSKASPDKAVVIRHLEQGNTAFLTCTGRLDEKLKRHVMDKCKPIEPERQYYTEDELRANWEYLIKRSARDNLQPLLSDAALAFGITELAVGVLAQKVLAGGVASIGERIAAKGPEAAEKVASIGKVLGGGANLFEGSRAVANDAYLRFFPSYIGAGTGMAWAGFNMVKNGDLDRSMQRGSVMSPFGYRSYSCGPHELHKELEVKGILRIKVKNPTIDEYEKTLRSALKMSQERPNSWAITERKNKELAKSDAEKTADESAPVLGPSVSPGALK
ncbi:MAG: hypothetical protein ACJ763_05190 [Bdellovibrionia bacterium]